MYSQVLYMSSSFWLLEVESRDFSHAEKERTACKAEQINSKRQPRTILCENHCQFVNLLSLASSFFSFSACEKSRDSTSNSQKLEDIKELC